MSDIIYDIECYPNIFTAAFYSPEQKKSVVFEISERKNQFPAFITFILRLGRRKATMVGFNNFGYDYPVIHSLILLAQADPNADWKTVVGTAREKNDQIIGASHHQRFAHIIWDRDQKVKQRDLFKIHHFDNKGRGTSLKVLEFNMRSHSIQDLPFDPCYPIPREGFDELIKYNQHDVSETYEFYLHTLDAIQLRKDLGEKYSKDFTNANDTKIGKTIFQLGLEESLGNDICFIKGPDGKEPRQTKRPEIHVKNIIFDYVAFERPEFTAVLDWMRRQTVHGGIIKSAFTGLDVEGMGSLADFSDLTTSKKAEWGPSPMVRSLNCTVDGLPFVFGAGGLHACIEPGIVKSSATHALIDLDVVSYYPSLAIENGIYPKHLTKEFCAIYRRLKEQRVKHAKGTPENAALKLALNGVYGDSNNEYSPFYDPQYTMSITINGQMLLCMLAEQLMEIEGLRMIQANTDGVTILIPRDKIVDMDVVRVRWEKLTNLELESVHYKRMFIRDVNNYIAEYGNGSLKRKGAYEYDMQWHQNQSSLVIQKAVEAHLLRGEDVRGFIEAHAATHPFDFYLRTKVPKSSKLWLVANVEDGPREQIQNVSRYYVSHSGEYLEKVMPPLPKKPDKWRPIAIQKGYYVTVHNTVSPLTDINFDYYVDEAMKLINPLVTPPIPLTNTAQYLLNLFA